MARIETPQLHRSGIPLGGIGTGTVEVRPDGHFYEWQVFNMGSWAPQQPECCVRQPRPLMPPEALAFFIRTQGGDAEPVVRHLGARPLYGNPYSTPWMKNVEVVEFRGAFPVARLSYGDASLPVDVEGLFFCPFIPHDARSSGTPGFYAAFTMRNTGHRPQSVSLLGLLRNPVAWGAPSRELRNELVRADGASAVVMRTGAETDCRNTIGSMAFSAAGGEVSHIAGEYWDYFRGYIGRAEGMARAHSVVFHAWREDGVLCNAEPRVSPVQAGAPTEEQIEAMDPAERREALNALRDYAFVRDLVDQLGAVDPDLPDTEEGVENLLRTAARHVNQLAGDDRADRDWGNPALCSAVELAPGEQAEVRFAVAWYFPNHYSRDGKRMGHQYENWFADAGDVARFLNSHYADLRERTVSFADALYDSSEDVRLADAWSGQLSTLAKSTWWTRDGGFGVWEGLGCCGLHTTDITYQGSFSILALFPQLQKRQMEMGARFQREDGRVHHLFSPDLDHVDDGFDRVDMNQQFVLLVCRDYLWTGDRAYLERMWPHVVRAMASTAQLDADGDGLPDRRTRRNTYDQWDMRGTPTYIAGLWLAALQAAVRLGEEMEDNERVAGWRDTLSRGRESFDAKLWNGRYYSLWVDGEDRDECCMTDQLSGEWFTTLIGLGHCLPRERIESVLQAAMEHNFRPEGGLRNATYPAGTAPSPATCRNFQVTGTWTGIEYAFASLLLEFGQVERARHVVRSIHDRQARSGRIWDHMECGDHYYRAMSSWAVLMSLAGFKLDAPRGRVTFRPAVEGAFRAPWCSPSAWGIVAQTADSVTVKCRSGELTFQELELALTGPDVRVRRDDRELETGAERTSGGLIITFDGPVRLHGGQTLTVEA